MLFDIEMLRFWISLHILISLPDSMIMSFRIGIPKIVFGEIWFWNNWNYLPIVDIIGWKCQRITRLISESEFFDMVNHHGCHLILIQIENKTKQKPWRTHFWVLHTVRVRHVCVHDVWQTDCLHFINQLAESIKSFTIIDIQVKLNAMTWLITCLVSLCVYVFHNIRNK